MSKTARKTAAVANVIAVTDFMKAWGGAQGEGRATAFREDPTVENIDALLDAARKNLMKIAKGGTIKTKKKATKVEKTTKVSTKKAAAAKIKAKAIKKLTAKIVSLREKREATDDKAKRAKLLAAIREAKETRADLKAA